MKNYLILFSIFFVAFVIRFYNFSDRFTFGPEQARSLMVSSNYIQDKPSLLGQEYFRSNSYGHKLYTSAVFNYTLVPLLLAPNYDPVLITVYFVLLFIFYIYFNLSSDLINFSRPVGMVNGLKYYDLKKTSNIISNNASDNFNVVTLYDFDTRGYTLRYLTQYIFNKKPQNEIYALAGNNYDFKNNNPWELNVFNAQNVVKLEDIGSGYGLYKLTK